jgi:cytosine permease
VDVSSETSAAARQGEEQIENLLGHEYEHEPVPASARRSAFSVTMVWLGFPMIITGAMTGSLLVLGMGFKNALVAMIIGNIIMFAYVGALGLLGTKRGMNFALIASIVFGKNGYILASGLLSTLLLGWYAVQTGITGALVSSTFGLNYVAMTVIAGLLYIAITFVGVRGLHWIGLASVPLFVVLGLWVAFNAASTTTASAIFNYAGNNGAASMSTAALAVPNANPFGADNMFGYMNGKQIAWLSVLAFIFLYVNLGSVCSHCLYNAATGWSRILGTHMRVMAVVLGVIGIVVAAGNVWAFFIQWLSLLGILVPPIGAIILIDQYVLRPRAAIGADWRPLPFIAWAIGSICAFIVEKGFPEFSTAISAAVVAGVAYYVLSVAGVASEKAASAA